MTVTTPPLVPTIWLKDYTMWIGGGKVGVDPSMARYLVELVVDGRHLLIEYDDDPANIADRIPQVEAVLDGVEFTP